MRIDLPIFDSWLLTLTPNCAGAIYRILRASRGIHRPFRQRGMVLALGERTRSREIISLSEVSAIAGDFV